MTEANRGHSPVNTPKNARSGTGPVASPLPSLHEIPKEQDYGDNPSEVRDTEKYQSEYVENFVERWDELIDWDARAAGEGRFFIDKLKEMGKHNILDVATGTGFHSVQLLKAGFNVTSADGNAQMLVKAFENTKDHGHVIRQSMPTGVGSTAMSRTSYLMRSSVSAIPLPTCLKSMTAAVPWRSFMPCSSMMGS